MAPYTYNNNFYDPVGSQSNQQPQGYTYSNNAPSTSAQYPSQAASTYGTNYTQQSYPSQYGTQTYGTSGQQASSQSTGGNTTRAAQDYSGRSNDTASQYDNTTWNATQNYASSAYDQLSNRSQANPSPLYATSSAASTFGRLSLPAEQQSQTSTNTFAGTQSYPTTSSNASTQNATLSAAAQHRSYMTAYTQQQTQPPPRYNSPLQAVQAQNQQKGHRKQASSSANAEPSPQFAARNLQQQQHRQQQQSQQQRQQSASVEPSPTTVDPSQVYDFRAEQERKARIDAEKRRKIQAEAAARKAEEDARQAEEDARKAEEARIEAEKAKAEEEAKKAAADAAKKKAALERKNEQRRKAREEKQKSKTAATALQQMASGAGVGGAASGSGSGSGTMAAMAAMMGDQSQPPANSEEAEMRAMFKKMREFNARNPDMLAKLWEEERTAHASNSSPQQPAQASPPRQQPPPVAAPTVPPLSTSGYKPFATPAAAPPPTGPSSNFRATQAAPPTPAPAQQTNAALWPPHKKGALAEAAAKWLALLPQNQGTGRHISREQVLKILDTNPSYVQLCEMIEKEGIRFERSALAKELLKAVPDGMKSQAGKPGPPAAQSRMTAQMNAAAAPNSEPKKRGRPKKDGPKKNWSYNSYALPGNKSNAGTVSYQTPSFWSLTEAAREINSMSTAPSYPATGSLASTLAGGAVQPPSDPFYDAPMTIHDDPAPDMSQPPEVKPEEPRRPPANKEEAARKRTFNDLVDLTKEDESEDEGPPRKTVFAPASRPSNGVAIPQQRPTNGTYPARNMTETEYRIRVDQQPRPMYAPIKAPLPSQPVPPKPTGPSQETLQADRVRGKMIVEPIMRDRVARKSTYDSRTIARDVLLATGRHPDMRALNAHFNTMQNMLGHHGGVVDGAGNKSDLATIKWDIIDPGEPAEAAKPKVRTDDPNETESEDADDESEKKPSAPQQSESEISHSAKDVKPRVGRPRTSEPKRRRRSSKTTRLPADSSTSTPRPVTATSADTPSPKSAMSVVSGTAIGYAAFKKYDENGIEIKRKGRPVGWRKDIHSRAAAGLTPAKAGHKPTSSASRLRQSTTAASTSPSTLKSPHYQVYPCGMKSCTAELDNIERLKKHLIKFHGHQNDEEEFTCEWKDCENKGHHVDKKGVKKKGKAGVATFDTIEEWLAHVDKVHLGPLRWKLGDGPRGEELHIDSDSYLSDATGRSVTPLIVPASDKPNNSSQPPSQTHQRRGPFSLPPSEPGPGVVYTKDEKDAIAELRKLEALKKKEGGFLGKQGGRLVNEKRRRGFLDDEDFEEVVLESD
ncbi:unnamed protein product [Zymoseptoria tritici ST99CH_1E4]|uniref:C2H2-type domain-containing protein n=1 Tax=Zymoseptoria tritici ST99CH_1E4 TaxID=1276532 RepID=A0A2H1GXL2_ZYMTR|nr:unnamed protein product [Zymoseptoria tritici ST99CH_1E4]